MTLEEETLEYAKKMVSFKFKPAVVVGVEFNKKRTFSHSRPCDSNIRNSLRNKLRQLGDIYIQRDGLGNPIGNCAEVNAVNELMIENENLDITNVTFSTPLRPRTQQKIEFCDNCKATFNL
jgi:hypothetical protein